METLTARLLMTCQKALGSGSANFKLNSGMPFSSQY